MTRRDVKKLTVEYNDGSTETFEAPGMFHVARNDWNRGDMSLENAFISHQIRWSQK